MVRKITLLRRGTGDPVLSLPARSTRRAILIVRARSTSCWICKCSSPGTQMTCAMCFSCLRKMEGRRAKRQRMLTTPLCRKCQKAHAWRNKWWRAAVESTRQLAKTLNSCHWDSPWGKHFGKQRELPCLLATNQTHLACTHSGNRSRILGPLR